jgi:hypothetical protein
VEFFGRYADDERHAQNRNDGKQYRMYVHDCPLGRTASGNLRRCRVSARDDP